MLTLIIESVRPSVIADFSGINNPKNAINVTNTAMWAINLFSFFKPLLQSKRMTPKKRGIIAVSDNVSFSGVASNVKYAQSGIKIKVKELIRLNFDTFILFFLTKLIIIV